MPLGWIHRSLFQQRATLIQRYASHEPAAFVNFLPGLSSATCSQCIRVGSLSANISMLPSVLTRDNRDGLLVPFLVQTKGALPGVESRGQPCTYGVLGILHVCTFQGLPVTEWEASLE
jgi:hypothetical protein